ncbi:MAG: hypothetical protein JWQ89_299 [Devosia sp.]|nr:hypothetical protein [Devosia sp.]MDB5538572.1 hypothetical protein [Devosia sp.]
MTNAGIIFNLAIAIRRLLIKADKQSSAAKFARRVLAEAVRELEGQQ